LTQQSKSQGETENSQYVASKSPNFRSGLPLFALIAGVLLLVLTSAIYVLYFGEFMGGSQHGAVFASFESLLGCFLCIGLSAFSFLLLSKRLPPNMDNKTGGVSLGLSRVISEAFFQNRKVMIFSAVAYGIFFGFVNGIIVYQPAPGYVPVALVYFPSVHAGLQLIPISVLLMISISLLVALSASLTYSAIKIGTQRKDGLRSGQKKSSFASALGAVLGTFAGCPTCAAAFFLSMLAGSGATAFSIYVSQYQTEIVALTIPVLLLSIYWQARSASLVIQGCKV
jgi:hypothetical protein